MHLSIKQISLHCNSTTDNARQERQQVLSVTSRGGKTRSAIRCYYGAAVRGLLGQASLEAKQRGGGRKKHQCKVLGQVCVAMQRGRAEGG